MKISFDFDSTLAEDRVQLLYNKLKEDGHDIYITTTRVEKMPNGIVLENRDLWSVCKRLGIDKSKVRFTNGNDKYHILDGFDIHFDDDKIEVDLINENVKGCVGVLVYDPEF